MGNEDGCRVNKRQTVPRASLGYEKWNSTGEKRRPTDKYWITMHCIIARLFYGSAKEKLT